MKSSSPHKQTPPIKATIPPAERKQYDGTHPRLDHRIHVKKEIWKIKSSTNFVNRSSCIFLNFCFLRSHHNSINAMIMQEPKKPKAIMA